MTWGIRSVSYKEVFFVLKIHNEPFSPHVDLTSHFILSACCLNSRDHTSLIFQQIKYGSADISRSYGTSNILNKKLTGKIFQHLIMMVKNQCFLLPLSNSFYTGTLQAG